MFSKERRNMASECEDNFFKSIKVNEGIRDPLTQLFPTCEVELTAALAWMMAREVNETPLNWGSLKDLRNGESLSDFQAVLEGGRRIVLTEHPLFTDDQEDIQNWGGMRADAIVASGDLETVILIESKVDSGFTFGNDWPSGQMARYAKFLRKISVANRRPQALLLLITPCWNADWYLKRYSQLVTDAGTDVARVSFAHITWEALFGFDS